MPLFGRKHVRLPMMNFNQVAQRPEARAAATTREFDCPFCGTGLHIPIRALNTRCTNCTQHLRLEDIVIRGDSPVTRVVTCGAILVEPSARFSGTLQANTVVIAGRVMGTIIGTQRVEVTATGKVAGTVATRDLACDPRALIDGQINILNPDGSVMTLATGEDHQPPKYRPGEGR